MPLFLENVSNAGKQRAGRKLVSQVFPSDDYFSRSWRGRGVVAGDLDSDGKPDLVFANTNEPAAILLNRSEAKGTSFYVELVGRSANRDAIGATVVLRTSAHAYTRSVVGGGSYLSSQSTWVHFAIPNGEVLQELQVRWPDGITESVREFSGDGYFQWVQSPSGAE